MNQARDSLPCLIDKARDSLPCLIDKTRVIVIRTQNNHLGVDQSLAPASTKTHGTLVSNGVTGPHKTPVYAFCNLLILSLNLMARE